MSLTSPKVWSIYEILFFNSTCKYAISSHLYIIIRFIVVSSLFCGGREECLSCAYNYSWKEDAFFPYRENAKSHKVLPLPRATFPIAQIFSRNCGSLRLKHILVYSERKFSRNCKKYFCLDFLIVFFAWSFSHFRCNFFKSLDRDFRKNKFLK